MECTKCHSEILKDSRFCSKCGTPVLQPAEISVTQTLQPPVKEPLIGTLFAGKYKIIKEVGSGGMGIVYNAEDTKLKRPVALKFLPPELGRDPEAKKRFILEAQAAAALSHPNICTVYEVEEAEGKSYIAMEFVAGQSLKDKLKKGPFKTEEAVAITIQAAEGLEEAHKKGIIHRDIKPGNIMLTDKGSAKVMDFGLAKLGGEVSLTREGVTLGTVAYMSPEQAQGKAVDHRTDIWSLGVVLYEMVSDRLPFKGDYEQSLIHSILKTDPEPIGKTRKDLPKGLESIILKALAKNPNARYQGMGEVLEDLKAVSEGLKPLRAKSGLFRGKVFGISKICAYAGLACLGILASVIAFNVGGVRDILFGKPKEATIRSLAVLPLANYSGDPNQEYFSDGMTDELITNLSKISALKVICRTSVMRFKGINKPLREIAAELGVDAVIEGSVSRTGNRVRIIARLIDPASESNLWTDSYERELSDVLTLQSEAALSIAKQIRAALTPEEAKILKRSRPVNPEAYNLYLKGLYFLARPNPESIQKALNFYHDALDQDPNFALAHAGVANVYLALANMNLAPPAEMYQKAKAALEKTLALDPDLAEAHAVAASLQFWFEWNWPAAEESYRRVLTLNPGDAMSRGQYAWLLMNRKRFDESVREIKHALSLDPLTPLFYAWSIALHNTAGRYDEALAEFTKLQQIDPNFGLAYFHAGMAYYLKGLYDEAIKTFEKGRELVVFPGWNEVMLLLSHLKKGDRKKADEILAAELEDRKKLPVSPVCIAWGFAALGDLDSAIPWLETAIQERDILMAFIHVYTEMIMPVLARDPRFDTILKKMNLTK